MADSHVDMERFAHDVCVHVLEKFGIFKAPDDSRKENKYVRHDFLTRITRSVVSFSFMVREALRRGLENSSKTSVFNDEEILLLLVECLILFDRVYGEYCAENMCVSLAVCTEYIQFVSKKGFTVSLNKLVNKWNKFFEERLKKSFEEYGGFSALYGYLEMSQPKQLNNFQEAFISENFRSYGDKICTLLDAKECARKHGVSISLDNTIYGLKRRLNFTEKSFDEKLREIVKSYAEMEQIKPESYPAGNNEETCSGTSDSEKDSSSSSDESTRESTSDSNVLKNYLLGIPPHEETLREIDPFFIENIPSPPKARSSSKSPQLKSDISDAPRPSSNSPKRETEANDASRSSSSNSSSREMDASDLPSPSSPDPEESIRKVEQILSNMEHDMRTLKSLLLEKGLFSLKSGRRGSRMRVQDSKKMVLPKDPESF